MLLTLALLLGFPAMNNVYWGEVLRSGVLPWDGDSIGIPIFGSLLVMFMASPFLMGITYLCIRRYNPDTKLLSWRGDRLARSATLTVIFGGLAIAVVCSILIDLRHDDPWYEYLWPGYGVAWLPWFAALRAAAVDELPVAHHPLTTTSVIT